MHLSLVFPAPRDRGIAKNNALAICIPRPSGPGKSELLFGVSKLDKWNLTSADSDEPLARLSLHLSKCHVVGNHMLWLISVLYTFFFILQENLVCGKKFSRANANMILMGGVLFGAIFIGVFADM